MSEAEIKLSVERVGLHIRYRKMFKGKVWTSRVYSQDSRRNKTEAWSEFLRWKTDRVDQGNGLTTTEVEATCREPNFAHV